MTISELIIRLRQIQLEHGDVPVAVYEGVLQIPITQVLFKTKLNKELFVGKKDSVYYVNRVVID